MAYNEEPRFEEKGPFNIAGIVETYTEATMAEIPALWNRFLPYMGKIPGQLGGGIAYGLVFPSANGKQWDYACGVEVADLSKIQPELKAFPVAKAKYAVFPHRGYLNTLRETFGYIWEVWARQSGIKIARYPRIEFYSADFRPDAPGGVEIWIPVEP